MYRRIGLIAATCFVMNGTLGAQEESGGALLKDLIKVMKVEANQKRVAADGTEHPDQGKLMILSSIEESSNVADPELRDLDQQLGSVLAHFSQPEVKEAAQKVRAEIRKKEKKAEEVRIAEAEALIERVKQTVKSAKEPSDLDALLADLSKMKVKGSSRQTEQEQNLYSTLESARRFVATWQDYLAAEKNNHSIGIRSALNNLLSGDKVEGFMPRSELLALQSKYQPGMSEITTIVVAIGSLDDIPVAISKLRGVSGPDEYVSTSNIIGPLSQIDLNYREWKQGLPVTVQLTSQGGSAIVPEINAKLTELRAEFMKLAIPRYVRAPEGTVAKPGETVEAFLVRLEEEARKAEDPPFSLRVRDLRKVLSRGSSYTIGDLTGINWYNAAKNQEEAKQFELAVLSYQQALRSGSDLVPVKTIGERLEILQREHPEEYKVGVERFLNPPPPNEMLYGEGRQPHRGQQNPAPAIVIPKVEDADSSPKKEASPAQGESRKSDAPKDAAPKEPAKTPPGN